MIYVLVAVLFIEVHVHSVVVGLPMHRYMCAFVGTRTNSGSFLVYHPSRSLSQSLSVTGSSPIHPHCLLQSLPSQQRGNKFMLPYLVSCHVHACMRVHVFNKSLGIHFMSSCLQDKHLTRWAISPAQFTWFCLRILESPILSQDCSLVFDQNKGLFLLWERWKGGRLIYLGTAAS